MKKTHISKRLLSILLSALMIITSVPLTLAPIVAEAAVKWTPIASSDFSSVNSVSQDVAFTPGTYNNQGNAMTWKAHTWPDSGAPSVANGAVYNPDGYMYLSGYSGGSVPITGHNKWKIDFGFRFKTTNSGDDAYYNSDRYSFLKMYVYSGNLANVNEKNAAFCYFAQNANGLCYSWADDGHNGGAQSRTTSITTGNGYLSANVDYHYVAEFTGDRFRAYITDNSGNIVQKIVDTTESTFIGRLNNISTNTINSIKIGDDDDDMYYKGLEYRNITFYSGEITSGLASVENLKSLMEDYETIMRNGTYTNMEAAYKAYVNANEAYDAAFYGNSNTAQISDAYSALQTAIGNMTPWNGYTGTYAPPQGTFTNDSQPASYYEGHYNNLLYMPTGQGSRSGYNDQSYLRVFISTPGKVVALYDGVNIAKYPALAVVRSNGSGRPRGLSCFYIGDNNKGDGESDRTQTNNYIYLDEPWYWGGAGNYDYTWNEAQVGEDIPYYYSTTTTSSTVTNGDKYLSGHICIKNENITFSNGYSMTTSGTVYFVGRNYNSGLHTYTSQNLNYITMVNYKPVYDLINSATNKAKLADVASYKEGGLLSLMQAYTTAQNFNPNNYNYSGTFPSQYGTDMQAVVSTFSSVSTTTDAAANYIALRNAIDYSGNPTALAQGNSSIKDNVYSVRELITNSGMVDTNNDGVRDKVLTGYDTLLTRYNEAVAVMAALGSADFNTNSSSDYTQGSAAATAATNLSNAFNDLSMVDLNVPTVSGHEKTYLGPADVITVTDTNGGYAAYSWEYSTDNGVNWTTGGSIPNAGGSFAPFSQGLISGQSTVKIRVKATRSTAEVFDNFSGYTHTYLSAPTISVADNAELVNYSKVRITQSNNSNYQLKYSIDYYDFTNDCWANNWTEYADPDNLNDFQPFTDDTDHSMLRIKVKQTNGTVTSAETTPVVVLKTPNSPVITKDGTLLDTSHGFTIADSNNDGYDGAVTIEYSYDNSNWTPYRSKVLPFSNMQESDDDDSKTIYARVIRNGVISENAIDTVKYLSRPVIKKGGNALAANDELFANDTLTIESTKNAAGGTLKYAFSIDGGNTWSDDKNYNGASVTPFAETVTIGGNSVDLSNKVNVMMKAWEEGEGSTSYALTGGPILLKKSEPLSIRHVSSKNVTSADTYDGTGTFSINTDGYEGCAIYYQAVVDGATAVGFNTYSINGGISASTYANNKVVTFRFYVIENNTKTVFATGTFINTSKYDGVVFKESFNGASASGTTLTLSGSNGTATATDADSFSIVEGAGYSDGTNSPDWRNNVLKINANSNTNYSIKLANNPLNDAAIKYIAEKDGVTISLWRYVPDGKFTNTAEYWTPTVSFSQPQGANGERYYFLTTESAYVTRSDSAIDQNNDYNKYIDIKPDLQDPTQHATGNRRNRWLNVVITVDPTSGVKVYTNGEPHNVTVTAGTGGSHGNYSGNNAALAQDILSFITNSATSMAFGDCQGYWSIGNKDLYLDDIRIYTGVKTQVDINNMYIYDADVKSNITSTSHDPTNVTVYTLARAVETENDNDSDGVNDIKPAGSKVGQEFIDFYQLDATNSDDVSAIDEYSFGTGMTVYHLNKTTGKWDVVGDNYGNCGYQNEKLFGGVYTTAIAAALNAATGNGSGAGAGYLVWAPHVMYNLKTDKWVYYGSTSSWGVQKSAIFMCQNDTNDDITGPYTYKQLIYTSTGHPNAIDPCVYYQYVLDKKNTYAPDMESLNMVFGSWGGSDAIASKALNPNGTTDSTTTYDRIIAAGISETASSDGGSAEGAWVTFENGYYYLYVSYGQNTGSYAERVFRSQTYNNNFIDLAEVPATNTENKMKGNQILSPFDMANYDYTFKSTGHNSVYKTVNDKGEVVVLHSTHARPNTNSEHNWLAIPDNALATCQSEVDGNLNLINLVAYNSLGWPVLMPFQYDGTDTVKAEVKAKDIEGVYAADDLRTYVSDTWASQYTYTIIADEEDENAAYEYGTDNDGDVFTDYIVLSTGADGTRYANYYDSKSDYDPDHPNNNLAYCGVVGKHGDTIGISMICPADREHTWTYRIGNIPHSEDVDSLGDSVSMDGVIYTHANTHATGNASFTYALYGVEISDDFQYGLNDLHQGERCTTITTVYPAMIDTSNPTAIYCVSDEAIAKLGDYAGGDFSVVALNGNQWFDDSGNRFSDSQALALKGISDIDHSTLKRRYGLEGSVSNYYYNSETGYKDTGVELIVSYVDISTGSKYSEFEFCYVMANPSMAHTISGSRNEKSSGGGADLRAGIILFDRFIGSTGTATSVRSNYTYQYGWNDSNYYKKGHETGIFNYLSEWGSAASLDDNARDYKTPENMANNFHSDNETVNGRTFQSVNSGAFAQIEIDREVFRDTVATATYVIDTDYYVDYSNTDNYDVNNKYGTITTNNGVPTGYKFTMKTTNINWAPQQPRRWGATSYMLNNIVDVNGNRITADASYDATRDTLPSAPYQNYSDYGDDLNNDGNGETRLYYGNVNNDTMNSDNATYESGIGRYSTNTSHYQGYEGNDKYDFQNKHLLGLGDSAIGRKVMSGYYTNTTAYNQLIADNDYYSKGIYANGRDANGNLTFAARTDGRIEKAFDYIDSGNSKTNAWNMHIDFSGKNSVKKNTDTTLPAEQYANFILEQGIATMSWWTVLGFDARHATTNNEVYKYYNIGVHTCDKGAARSFAENYLRKRLELDANGNVVVNQATGAPYYLDEDGQRTPNIAEADIINPKNYTLESYQAYIDAVAELNYFVKNPTNTTFADYANSGATAQNGATEYTTAYSNGSPIYIAETNGYDIFGSGTTATDAVQARLIQNVITAYENLFEITVYADAEEAYGLIDLLDNGQEITDFEHLDVSDIDTIRIHTAGSENYEDVSYVNYTEDSWEAFVKLVVDLTAAFNYTKDNTKDTSWRRTELTKEQYEEIKELVSNAQNILLPIVNTAALAATKAEKQAVVNRGVFENDVQKYTLSSLNTLSAECTAAQAVIDAAQTHQGTINSANIVNPATGEGDFTYTMGQYAVTGVTRYTFGDGVEFHAISFNNQPSDAQAAVNTENTTLSGMDLAEVADYDTYNALIELMKYQDLAAVSSSYIDNPASPYGIVAAQGTDAASVTFSMGGSKTINTAAYDSNTPGKCYVQYSNDIYKDCSDQEALDAQMRAIKSELNAINEGTSGKTAQYTVTFNRAVDGNAPAQVSSTTAFYGARQTLAPAGGNTNTGWEVNMSGTTAKYPAMASYGFNVQGNVTVTSYESTGTVPEGKVKVTVRGVYGGSVLAEFFVDDATDITLGSGTVAVEGYSSITVDNAAFFAFNSWKVNSEAKTNGTYDASALANEDSEIVIQPVCVKANAENDLIITLNGNTVVSSDLKESYQIINSEGAYAIAAKDGDDVYVVAYSDTFNVYLVKSLDLFTITKSDSTYSLNGTEITDAALIKKLNDKTPFVYSYSFSEPNDTKVKFTTYSAVSQGTTSTVVEQGTIYAQNNVVWTEDNFVIGTSGVYTNQAKHPNDYTGQYWLAINTSKSIVTRGYVKYSYTVDGVTITTIEYGNIQTYTNS